LKYCYLSFLVSILLLNCLGNIQNLEKPSYGILKPTIFDTNECKTPPEGMVCIPSSSKTIGDQRNVQTFYIDKYEITNTKYEQCVLDKSCKPNQFMKLKLNKIFAGSQQPAIGLTYEMAHQFCVWDGKRLPSEAEWTKAYFNYSNSDSKSKDCSTDNFPGCKGTTLDVGSYPNPLGVYDLDGNATEWVNDWADECNGKCNDTSCGEVCVSKPKPCSGKFPCQKFTDTYLSIEWDQLNLDGIRKSLVGDKFHLKKLKGNSFEFPLIKDILSDSKIADINDINIKAGARCASDNSILNRTPAWVIKSPPQFKKNILAKMTKDEEYIISQNFEKDDIDKKPLCKTQFTSPANCRDPVSYIKPNEARNYLFAPYIKNIRGGYIGIAADANYTFLTYAKSEYVWLMDFNINIVNLHKINQIFIIESETAQEFLSKWNPKNRKDVLKILESNFGSTSEWKNIKNFYEVNQAGLYEHYYSQSFPEKLMGDFGWLRNPDNYSYLRNLHILKRISIFEGDLLKNKTLFNIGNTAKKLNIPIRIFYPSNAEEFWKFSKNYKRNILNLPFDEATLILRTVHEFPWHKNENPKGTLGFWHYVVHGGYNYQKKLSLPDYNIINDFKEYRLFPDNQKDFSTIEIPETLPFEIK
jgi:hypothetical protein